MSELQRKIVRSTGYGDVIRTNAPWKPKKKPKKKSPGQLRKTVVKEADRLASLVVRSAGRCVHKEGCKGGLVCGHLFSRVAYSTRWEEMNLYCLCSYHNIRQENDPMVARDLLSYAESMWGFEAIEQLHAMYSHAVPVKTWEIEAYRDLWKARLDDLKAKELAR